MRSGTAVSPRWGRELERLLELLALCGFVIAQPVLSVVGHSPEVLVFWGLGTGEIVALAAAIALVPPILLWAVGDVTLLAGSRPRQAVHVATVGLLVGLLGVLVLRELSSPGTILSALFGVAAGVAGAWIYTRRDAFRLWVRYASPAPAVFVATFLLVSPASDLVLPGGGRSEATPAGSSHTPLVVVILDELPLRSLLDEHGQIEKRLYPEFAHLAGNATWYRNATGIAGYTPYAIPAMLSGKWPEKAVAPVESEYPETLFTLLRDSHDIVASEAITDLCPSECEDPTVQRAAPVTEVAGETFRLWTELVSPWSSRQQSADLFTEEAVDELADEGGGQSLEPEFALDRLEENQPRRFSDFLAALQPYDGGRPPFYFLHLVFPHQPWRYLPFGRRAIDEHGPKIPERWPDDPWLAEVTRQRHLLQVAYTDRLVGELVDRLKTIGLYDDAAIVLTADHGISFTPGTEMRRYQSDTAHEIAWVPTIVKAPGQQRGQVSDRNWMHVDLVPTVADLLGVTLPWNVDGISALDAEQPGRQKQFYAEPGEPRSVDVDRSFPAVLEGMTAHRLPVERGPEGLFAPGPYGAIFGRAVDSLDVGDASSLTAELEDSENLDSDDPAGRVPALIQADVDSGTGTRPTWVAVAVNGRVGGLGRFVETGGGDRLVAMVAGWLFTRGTDEISLYGLSGPPDAPALARIALHS